MDVSVKLPPYNSDQWKILHILVVSEEKPLCVVISIKVTPYIGCQCKIAPLQWWPMEKYL